MTPCMLGDMSENETYDVVVIGGGAAGLSGAMALGRSRRSVLVVDAGEPRNAPAGHAHNYLGREGVPPLQLLEDGRAQVAAYGVEVLTDRVVGLSGAADSFLVTTEGGRRYAARRVLVTGGVVDELPDVPGWPSGGASTCCTVPTATAGRCATSRSACSATDRWPCTRP